MSNQYYKEKVMKLHEELFLSPQNSKDTFINCEDYWFDAYLSSTALNDANIKLQWENVWLELNSNKSPNSRWSDFHYTIRKKQSRGLKKYLLFVLEKYYELL